MIISRTPFRISFFGGGTDYPLWFKKNKGAVLATSIDKYCYITCRYLPPFFKHKSRIIYSQMEEVQNINEIDHPAVREVLRFLKIHQGVEVHHDGDLPARTGLGSSSSFTVGLL
ncbi:MAG: kinase, partial [Candidatus Omnitrophica bacterium]|nr:kinase [Candidatus Omnitrophota bacterium]